MSPEQTLVLVLPDDGGETVVVSKKKLEDVLRRLEELEKRAKEFEV